MTMVLLLFFAGLHLEVAKLYRIVTAAQREEFGCRSCRRVSWEEAQSRSNTDKRLFRQEVAERRGASAKTSLSKEVAQQKQTAHSLIHPSTRPSIHPIIHPSFNSFICSFIESLLFIGSFMYPLIHSPPAR